MPTESKPSWKRSEGKQLWCLIGFALILILSVVAIWPWLRVVLWPHQEINLYFSRPEGLYLGSEKRKFKEATPSQVTLALISGPQSDKLTNSIPRGTKLLSVKLIQDTVHVDLSEEFSTGLVDKRQEFLALYSIVNTLTNLPGIERVQFLIEGSRRDTLHGNVNIRTPLEADRRLIVGAGD